jgi:ATP-dependent DNA helicase HFM1/MER3
LFKDAFPYFNLVQSSVFDDAIKTDKSLVVSAPTGSGKTVVFELAIIRELLARKGDSLCVYVAPIKALCSERFQDWSKKFQKIAGNFVLPFKTWCFFGKIWLIFQLPIVCE